MKDTLKVCYFRILSVGLNLSHFTHKEFGWGFSSLGSVTFTSLSILKGIFNIQSLSIHYLARIHVERVEFHAVHLDVVLFDLYRYLYQGNVPVHGN